MQKSARLSFSYLHLRLAGICAVFVLFTTPAQSGISPPSQDYYLNVLQSANFCCGEDLWGGGHQIAWVDQSGVPLVSEALTVEAWVLWEDSDFGELEAITGSDLDRMTLFCGLPP